jgi:hypothetical protein
MEDEIGSACSMNGEESALYWVLAGKPDGKRSLGRRRHLWVYNVEVLLIEIRWGELISFRIGTSGVLL